MITEMQDPAKLVSSNHAPLYCIWLQTDTIQSVQIFVWDGTQFQTNDNIDLKVAGVFEPEQLVTHYQRALKVANLLDIDGTITVLGLTRFKP